MKFKLIVLAILSALLLSACTSTTTTKSGIIYSLDKEKDEVVVIHGISSFGYLKFKDKTIEEIAKDEKIVKYSYKVSAGKRLKPGKKVRVRYDESTMTNIKDNYYEAKAENIKRKKSRKSTR